MQGREIVEMSPNPQRLLEMAAVMNNIDIGVTIRRAYDTFREQIVGIIVEWLRDLTRCRVGADTTILREVIAHEMLQKRKKDLHAPSNLVDCHKVVADIKDPTRLDWLFLYHSRLWKKARLTLKQVYVSVSTTNADNRLAVGS